MPKPTPPQRPRSVPKDAVWVEKDQEWELAPRDSRKKMHGKVRWWRRDGSLVCECEYAHGVAHGAFTRYHDDGTPSRSGTFVRGKMHGVDTAYRSAKPTTEQAFPNTFGARVWRYEIDRDMDRVLASRWFDKRGRPVTATGEPMPPRPASVPARATFEPVFGVWIDGETDALLARHGTWRTWNKRGSLTSEVQYAHGVEERRVMPDDDDDVREREPAPAARRSALFGTDCAGDWLDDLDDRPSWKTVERALARAANPKPRAYLDVDDCEAAVAAAGCVAQIRDKKPGPLGKTTLAVLAKAFAAKSVAERKEIVRAASRAVSFSLEDDKRSELCQLHEDDGPRSPWRTAMKRLRARLDASTR
ncbi:MAG: DUF4259 domain-containing protein [Polyangiaceae bacterium]